MSQSTYNDFELKIFMVVKEEEAWEGDGLVINECFEIRDGDNVLASADSLSELFKCL